MVRFNNKIRQNYLSKEYTGKVINCSLKHDNRKYNPSINLVKNDQLNFFATKFVRCFGQIVTRLNHFQLPEK